MKVHNKFQILNIKFIYLFIYGFLPDIQNQWFDPFSHLLQRSNLQFQQPLLLSTAHKFIVTIYYCYFVLYFLICFSYLPMSRFCCNCLQKDQFHKSNTHSCSPPHKQTKSHLLPIFCVTTDKLNTQLQYCFLLVVPTAEMAAGYWPAGLYEARSTCDPTTEQAPLGFPSAQMFTRDQTTEKLTAITKV